jgi:hypothetical protein
MVQQAKPGVGTEIGSRAAPQMVAVRVRNDGAVYRLPRIDMKPPGGTVQSGRGRLN